MSKAMAPDARESKNFGSGSDSFFCLSRFFFLREIEAGGG